MDMFVCSGVNEIVSFRLFPAWLYVFVLPLLYVCVLVCVLVCVCVCVCVCL